MYGQREEITYVKIANGRFQRKARPGDDVRLLRTVEVPDGINYDMFEFTYLEGIITGLYITNREIKGVQYDFLNIRMAYIGETAVLQLFLDSNPGRDILTRYENIGQGEVIQIHIGSDSDNRQFLWITSNDAKVSKKYSKDTPHDMPQWEKVTHQGRETWDRTKLIQWWKHKIKGYDIALNPGTNMI